MYQREGAIVSSSEEVAGSNGPTRSACSAATAEEEVSHGGPALEARPALAPARRAWREKWCSSRSRPAPPEELRARAPLKRVRARARASAVAHGQPA